MRTRNGHLDSPLFFMPAGDDPANKVRGGISVTFGCQIS